MDFWHLITPMVLARHYWHFAGTCWSSVQRRHFFYPQDGGSKFLRSYNAYQQSHTY